jgi:hypothetical protein
MPCSAQRFNMSTFPKSKRNSFQNIFSSKGRLIMALSHWLFTGLATLEVPYEKIFPWLGAYRWGHVLIGPTLSARITLSVGSSGYPKRSYEEFGKINMAMYWEWKISQSTPTVALTMAGSVLCKRCNCADKASLARNSPSMKGKSQRSHSSYYHHAFTQWISLIKASWNFFQSMWKCWHLAMDEESSKFPMWVREITLLHGHLG